MCFSLITTELETEHKWQCRSGRLGGGGQVVIVGATCSTSFSLFLKCSCAGYVIFSANWITKKVLCGKVFGRFPFFFHIFQMESKRLRRIRWKSPKSSISQTQDIILYYVMLCYVTLCFIILYYISIILVDWLMSWVCKMLLFGVVFFISFLKLSAGRGFKGCTRGGPREQQSPYRGTLAPCRAKNND